MRWDNLFDDLESQLEHELNAEEVDLQAEEERLRLGRLSLRDRLVSLQASGASEVRIRLSDGSSLRMRPLAFGRDWVSADVVEEGRRRSQIVVPLAAVGSIQLDRAQVRSSLETPSGQPRGLTARLSLAFVLRDLCRRRSTLELVLADGTVHGTIDRVGRDHCDVAVHDMGSARRDSEVQHYLVVPLSQLLLVRM